MIRLLGQHHEESDAAGEVICQPLENQSGGYSYKINRKNNGKPSYVINKTGKLLTTAGCYAKVIFHQSFSPVKHPPTFLYERG